MMARSGVVGKRASGLLWKETNSVNKTDGEKDGPPPDTGMQTGENDGMLGRREKVIDAAGGDEYAVRGEQDPDKEPDGDEFFVMHGENYQKMMLRATNTTITTLAQNRGF